MLSRGFLQKNGNNFFVFFCFLDPMFRRYTTGADDRDTRSGRVLLI